MLSSRSVVLSAFWFLWAGWTFYYVDSHRPRGIVTVTTPSLLPPPQPWCGVRGPVDSIAAEVQARRALGEAAFDSNTWTLYSLNDVERGFLVGVGPRPTLDGPTLDGGGLVWVDRASGCVMVLSR